MLFKYRSWIVSAKFPLSSIEYINGEIFVELPLYNSEELEAMEN